MTNRIIYAIGLVFSFVLLITLFILTRFSRETADFSASFELLGNGTWYARIEPASILKEGILRPMLNASLTEDERAFFTLPDARPEKLQETGINWLAPIFFSLHRIEEKSFTAVYVELSEPDAFANYGKNDTNAHMHYVNRGNQGIIIWADGIAPQHVKDYVAAQLGKTPKNVTELLTSPPVGTLIQCVQHTKEGKAYPVRMFQSKDGTQLHIEGTIHTTQQLLQSKLGARSDAFYLLVPLPEELMSELVQRLDMDAALQNELQKITGIELNYSGIVQHPATKKPHPRIELFLHTNSADSLWQAIRQIDGVTTMHDSIIRYNALFRGHYQHTNSGLLIRSMKASDQAPEEHAKLLEISGNTAAIIAIDEPYLTLLLAMDKRVGAAKMLLDDLADFQLKATATENGLVQLSGRYQLKSNQPILFRTAFFFRQLI